MNQRSMRHPELRLTDTTYSVPPKTHLLIISSLLFVVALIAFWQVIRFDFINYDDPQYVIENGHIQDGLTLRGIAWAFTTGSASNWHPLTWISHMVDVQLFGLQPGWHHLTSLLFHCANTVLLFLVLYRMTRAVWQCAFVAALFALHPLHVESVSWVAERKDVLSTFFWMLTMGAYVFYTERPGLIRYLAVPICFALGLMAKPMLVTLPFVLLLLDYWPLGRVEQKKLAQEVTKPTAGGKKKRKKEILLASKPAEATLPRWALARPLLIEKFPLFALTLASSIVTYLVQQHGGALGTFRVMPPGARLANALVSYVIYMLKMLWPTNLAVHYPHPGSWPLWEVLGSVIVLVAITALVVRGVRKYPCIAVGWFWYIGTLVPVIGIVQVGMQAMADRYTYVPLIGLFIIVAWGVPDVLKNRPRRKEALIASWVLCLFFLFAVTWKQIGYWQNSISLYDHALEVTERNPVAHNNRGIAYMSLGKYAQAISDFDRTIEINPGYGQVYYNRGLVYMRLGKYAQAISDFDRTIEINPRHGKVYSDQGIAYCNVGAYAQAMADFAKAVEIDPGYARAYFNRAICYGRLGNYAQVVAEFSKGLEFSPGDSRAYYDRGHAYMKLGDSEHAIDDLRTAARLGHEAAMNLLRSQGIDW